MKIVSFWIVALLVTLFAEGACAQRADTLPTGWQRSDTMITMRDGVQLHTVIVSPGVARDPLPILLTRTAFGARPSVPRELGVDGYLFVYQDIRGRAPSQGSFVMNRPPTTGSGPPATDESTDTWDSVDWLIHHLPRNNGRVGITGISYSGWLAEMALLGPHPAVKAVSLQAPVTDAWMGDDFFHQGAFREMYSDVAAWIMEAGTMPPGGGAPEGKDLYDWYLSFPTLKALTEASGYTRIPTGRRFIEHPAYDSAWQRRAFQKLLTTSTVPTLTVGGWWDSEDLFGPQAAWKALDRAGPAVPHALVIGPWAHRDWANPGGDSLGALRFGSATADSFRAQIEAPWWAYWLKGRGTGRFPTAVLFDAGSNQWRTFDAWPPRTARVQSLYFHANGVLSFDVPAERAGFDHYLSDPAHPVPMQPRPITDDAWPTWMTRDQRFLQGRTGVLTWQTPPLEHDVVIGGDITARLFAATTGSDADWVVKLIDVYPDSDVVRREMRGYQLMIAGDVMRGRYRQSFERATPIVPNAVARYTVDMHQQLYTFRAGHRIMVQVQSSWFPLYDRNPQTWTPNIFLAPATAYRAQTHRIYRTAMQPSHVEVTVLR